MNKKKVLILGAQGMAEELYTYYKSDLSAFSPGFVVSSVPHAKFLYDKPIFNTSVLQTSKDYLLIGAIGSPERRRWISKLEDEGFNFDTFIHHSVIIDDTSFVNKGSIICPHVVLTHNVKIGKHTIINTAATISHDCILGDYIHVSPGVNIAGNVSVGNGSWIGIGSLVIQRIKIGKNVFIGAGSVVVDDIPDNSLVYGVPAKPQRKISSKDWND